MKWFYSLDGFVEKHLIKKIDGFLCLVSVSNQNYNNMKKNCTSYLIYRQIWLNLPVDDCHFGCISYFIKKNTWVVPRVFEWCSHTGDCPQKGPQWTSTHQCTIHGMPVITQLWMNVNWVNIWFNLGNQFCKK
jgi:hypothetical protein